MYSWNVCIASELKIVAVSEHRTYTISVYVRLMSKKSGKKPV